MKYKYRLLGSGIQGDVNSTSDAIERDLKDLLVKQWGNDMAAEYWSADGEESGTVYASNAARRKFESRYPMKKNEQVRLISEAKKLKNIFKRNLERLEEVHHNRGYSFGPGFVNEVIDYKDDEVTVRKLREGEKYVWIMGASPIMVTYVGRDGNRGVNHVFELESGSKQKLSPYDVKKYIKFPLGEGVIREYEDDEMDWEDEMPSEPQPEDITLTPTGRLGSKIGVGIVDGKFLGEFDSEDEALDYIKKWMEKNQFWPTIWWISDHGNAWPIDGEGNEIRNESINEAPDDFDLGGAWYIVSYYERVGEHGQLSSHGDFDSAYRAALKFYEEQKASGDIESLDYIGVESNTEAFAVVYITDFYIKKRLSKSDFQTADDYAEFMQVAYAVQKSGKPSGKQRFSTGSDVRESVNEADGASEYGDEDNYDLKAIAEKLNQMSSRDVSEELEKVSDAIGGYGVEAVTSESEWVSHYYQNIVMEYINMGDTYTETIVHDTVEGQVYAMSWGDWVEKYGDEYGVN